MKKLLFLVLTSAVFLSFYLHRSQVACAECLVLPALTDLPPRPPVPTVLKLDYPAPPPAEEWSLLPPDARLSNVRERVKQPLADTLKEQNLQLGAPTFIRVFKETRELELWLKKDSEWKLFRTYPIAAMSGKLGPKLKEGDGQAPEGFYEVTQGSLNPNSTFHLSFNIGYPNAYDQHHGRTGNFIMVHGNQVSIGCFAMTDPVVEEIYLLVEAALAGGQKSVPVHSFPFHLKQDRLAQMAAHPAASFWQELQPGYLAFQDDGHVPEVKHQKGRYQILR